MFLFDHSDRGKIKVSGNDRVDFLHRLLTNDVRGLKTGGTCYACLLSAPGKVLLMMRVWILPDFILLETEPGFAEKGIAHLDKFLITDDVRLEDATRAFGLFSATGNDATSFIRDREKEFLMSAQGSETAPLPVFHILTSPKKMEGVSTHEVWEALRIEAGWPVYGIDFDEMIMLPETGLESLAASETKGCYPGQEVVARMETYRGHQKKFVKFLLEGDALPARGAKVFSGEKEIGWITSAVRGIALGYAAKGYFEQENGVQIKNATGMVNGKIIPLFPAQPPGPSSI